MGTRWTAEQVLSLAPDASSKSAARALSTPAPWSDTGTVKSLVWGRCRGTGSKPYQTVVDLDVPAYQCTCPSRKSPCKHALGLLLIWAAGGVPDVAEPGDFVAVWADSRENRAAAADGATRVAAPKDPEQAARTAARRQQRVTQGLAELDVWLRDQVRTGIAGASADAYRRFDGMAARMVDAQAPGAAATLRRLPQVTSSGPGWPGRLLAELAQLRLLVAAHERLGELPDPLAATVRSRIGYTVSAEEVLTTAPVRDLWHVLGSTESDSGSLVTRRTWLWAAAADRPALVLSFGAGGQQPDRSLVGGTALDAELHFYPGQPPLRALLGRQHAEAQTLPGITPAPRPRTVARLLDDHADARAQDPWLTVWPALLDVRPARGGGQWRLLDEGGDSLPMRAHRESLWPVLAASGGDVVTVAAELSDGWLYPVGVWPRPGVCVGGGGLTRGGLVSRRSVAWDELVTAATVGTSTRALPHTGFHPTTVTATGQAADDDPATHLLDLAAMESAASAVTVEPAPATPVDRAPAETRAVATERLASLLLQAVRLDRELAGDLVDLVAASALVLPTSAVPAFLDLGRDARFGPSLSAVVGERGRWLVGLDPDWAELLPAVPRDPSERPVDLADWQGGGWEPRDAYLLGLRRVDPAAARELLASAWAREPGEDRIALLSALEQGLGPEDVPFLEAALRDRRDMVRQRVVSLLVRLGGQLPLNTQPAFGRRNVARARPLVRLGRQGLRRSAALEVIAPETLDEVARRDAIVDRSGGFQKGKRAWWLEQILMRTPLPLWENEFRRSPTELVALPVAGDFARELHRGWAAAAVAQQNAAWARALLATSAFGADPSLVSVLTADERSRYAHTVLRSAKPGDATLHPLLARVDGPWSPELATAVVEYAEWLLPSALVRESTPLLRLAARRLPVRVPLPLAYARATSEDWADQRARDFAFDHPWRTTLTSLSATLSLRASVADEFRRSAP